MAKIKVELLSGGMHELLNSKDLESGLEKLARDNSGGWLTDIKKMTGGKRSRVIASIYSVDQEAIAEELETHKIVGGLR